MDWETGEELNIRLEGKDIKQVKNIVYLCGNMSENGRVGGWRGDAKYKQELMHEKMYGGNDGRKDFQNIEGEGPGFLHNAS